MSAAPVLAPVNEKTLLPEWRSLYLTALFETDKVRLPGRILRAERALMIRERQLFTTPSNSGERAVVINALNALHALRRCLG
jgi:hypothetical protein